ncbi:hypothetical protein [Streptomyces poonensis]|uniref:Uncharacterized protein n=1 Tax=Streptomyces poonensis TaxID=68255 RepID=A0A918PFB9_9ACTN|nr:hypothetical protein [Streptomyces poonensis]GGZ05929.1 hypothetical protein GCM10010365_26510 [Streptomyces poonensis]GLJ92615.1 hypothetical protein GCM10017589_52250 [Streptomyces poonensis]
MTVAVLAPRATARTTPAYRYLLGGEATSDHRGSYPSSCYWLPHPRSAEHAHPARPRDRAARS